jgi:hypothetical protein
MQRQTKHVQTLGTIAKRAGLALLITGMLVSWARCGVATEARFGCAVLNSAPPPGLSVVSR